MKTIEVNAKNLKILKRLYKKAQEHNQKSFEFQDGTLLMSYAKYVIEHMENAL